MLIIFSHLTWRISTGNWLLILCVRGQGKHVKRSVWIGQSRLMSLLLLYKSRTNCLAFHPNSCRHQASAVSGFLKIPNIVPPCLCAQWRWLTLPWLILLCGISKAFYRSASQVHWWATSPLAFIWKAKQPRSWITYRSTQVKRSTGVTKVNEHVARNVILDIHSHNQQLNVQNSLGWNNPRRGFVFCLQDDSFISFSAQCFFIWPDSWL